jgi:hypothetical protein
MDPFVRRLVEHLLDPTQPLSRNRHFQTFESPEGKSALRIARRLKSLASDVRKCRDEGGAVEVEHRSAEQLTVELTLVRLSATRKAKLEAEELELLEQLTG